MKSKSNLFPFILFASVLICPRLRSQPVVPNDPLFGQQWYLAKISATNAWATTTGNSNIVVVVFDTGIDYTHPDLTANMWRNPGETGLDANGNDKASNGIDDDGNGYVDDVHGIDLVAGTGNPMDKGYYAPPLIPANAPVYHGTFIAGVIGAVGNNSLGIAGINWSVQIMAIRVIGEDQTDPSEYFSEARLFAAWNYVLKMKRRGVNIRVTSHSEGLTSYSDAARDAIVAAGNEGILTIIGAGNDSLNHDSFAGYFSVHNLAPVIYVANSDESDQLSGSDFGASTVHLAAPGHNVTSTAPGANYRTASGTSYSCPLVAGAAALLLAAKPELSADGIKALLLGSVDQPPALRGKLITGGRLNIGRAMSFLTQPSSSPIVITALPAGARTPGNFPIQVTFDRPMDRASVEASLVITPPVTGSFDWSEDGRSLWYRHYQDWFDGSTNYTVRIRATARDTAGNGLDGNFNRNSEATPTDDFVWTFRFPVANDDFQARQMLAGDSGVVPGNNYHTIYESGEAIPNGFFDPYNIEDLASVWYDWTSPAQARWFTFDVVSAGFDSYLAVYTQPPSGELNQLQSVAQNDNYGTRVTSRVSFSTEPATHYLISVIGKNGLASGQSGPFTMRWYPTPTPGFTGTQFTPASGIPGTKVTFTGTNFTGVISVLFNGASASFTNALTNNLDLRIIAVVPPDAISGPITIVTPHGSATTTAAFQVQPPPLTIRMINTSELEIAWAATSAEFVLEMTEDLNSASWTPIAQLPVRANDQSKLTLPVPAGSHFYRLKRN